MLPSRLDSIVHPRSNPSSQPPTEESTLTVPHLVTRTLSAMTLANPTWAPRKIVAPGTLVSRAARPPYYVPDWGSLPTLFPSSLSLCLFLSVWVYYYKLHKKLDRAKKAYLPCSSAGSIQQSNIRPFSRHPSITSFFVSFDFLALSRVLLLVHTLH